MTWYFGGAALITVLFVLNAAYVHVLRSREAPARWPLDSQLERAMSGREAVLVLLPVAALGLGVAIRTLAPDNPFGRLMASPWVVACMIPYMTAIGAVIAVVAGRLRRRALR